MRNFFFVIIVFFLLFAPVFQADVWSNEPSPSAAFDTTGFPQWALDLRRWEIIAFGTFPFSLLISTFFMDFYRWYQVDFNDNRYAPWPFRSAGAVQMTGREFETTLWIAASLSAAVALVDFMIVVGRRNRERRRMENIPSGTVVIERAPNGIPEEELPDDMLNSE